MVIRAGARIALATLVAGAGLSGLTACSSSSGDNAGVTMGLQEFSVTPDPVSFKAGKIEVTGKNNGGVTHEMVIVRAKSADSLATKADGSQDEDQIAEADKQGEIEDILVGKSKSKTFDLAAGTYVVFCNITEKQADGSVVSHFAQGMHETITVK